MSAQHTPAPWHVLPGSPDENPGIQAADCSQSIVIWGWAKSDEDDGGVRGRTPDEAMANARLIAAAPELLEALMSMVVLFEGSSGAGANYWEQFDEYRSARAVIAKAKGKTK